MFGIDSSELAVIALVALLVIGPKDLPRVMRMVGQWVSKGRAMTRHVRAGFDTMMREAELEEMQKQWAAQNDAIIKATALPSLKLPDLGRIDSLAAHGEDHWMLPAPPVVADPIPIATSTIAKPRRTRAKSDSTAGAKVKAAAGTASKPARTRRTRPKSDVRATEK